MRGFGTHVLGGCPTRKCPTESADDPHRALIPLPPASRAWHAPLTEPIWIQSACLFRQQAAEGTLCAPRAPGAHRPPERGTFPPVKVKPGGKAGSYGRKAHRARGGFFGRWSWVTTDQSGHWPVAGNFLMHPNAPPTRSRERFTTCKEASTVRRSAALPTSDLRAVPASVHRVPSRASVALVGWSPEDRGERAGDYPRAHSSCQHFQS